MRARSMVVSFLGTFAITIVGLLVTTLIIRAKASKIGAAAEAITRNAAPSVDKLSTLRMTLRHLEVGLGDYVDQIALEAPAAAFPATLERDRRSLRREWNSYRALPTFSKEETLAPEIGSSLSELDGAIDRLLPFARNGDHWGAKALFDQELKSRFDEVGGKLHEAMALNVAASTAAAGEIETTRREISHLSNALYGAWSIFALFAAVVAVRLARRYAIATEQQIAELELFAGRLAHDVRNPLSSVALAVTLSQERASDEKSRELLGRARRTLVRIGELMEGLLLLAKAVRTNEACGPASVSDVILDVVENFRPLAAENAIDLDLGAVTRCSVACSPGILTNMIGNLLDNSIKYMGDSAVRSVVVSALDSGGAVRIEVEDTGPGVPAAAHTRIFDLHARAATTEVQGLGLGLATVKKLAEALRGTVGVRPNRDCGSVFWIELPKMQAPDGKTLGT